MLTILQSHVTLYITSFFLSSTENGHFFRFHAIRLLYFDSLVMKEAAVTCASSESQPIINLPSRNLIPSLFVHIIFGIILISSQRDAQQSYCFSYTRIIKYIQIIWH